MPRELQCSVKTGFASCHQVLLGKFSKGVYGGIMSCRPVEDKNQRPDGHNSGKHHHLALRRRLANFVTVGGCSQGAAAQPPR